MAWLSTEFYFYKASAPCRAVWMTIKHLKVEVDEKEVDLLKAETKRPWFLRLNPQHCVPTLSDQGYVIWESRAIMQYLCNKYCTPENQHLYPTEPEQRGTVDRLLFFDMGTLTYAIKEYFRPKQFEGLPPDAEKENLLKQSLDYLDGVLETVEGGYLTGDKLTIADLAVLASLTELDAMGYAYKCYGNVTRWSNKLREQLPYYKDCCLQGIEMTKARIKQVEEDLKIQAEKERKASSGKK
ncbi:glutathione S-transferase 1-like isoform X1 [Hyalella azteca]|uniref:Glutathione S-transferase 1-like isoform X1 n=2 Tax=Hyalella azteca TaxID=294128 RepID=A0A8B7NKD7_HYAAZ|nr:glutathione S-transferase 1-like isoform X1 [Hyalella azteca]XP_018013756.1 glutathione S-transferase 1-like isoform X1 [Hyalella azteca]